MGLLPLWLAVLFVVPALKWFLFVTLGLVPGRCERASDSAGKSWSWVPRSKLASAAVAMASAL